LAAVRSLGGIRRKHCARALSVAVGISGGVDSAVSAAILQREGHHVIGVHMRNWDASDEVGAEQCPQGEDERDARAACAHLGIDLHRVDFVREYWVDVFEPFVEGYAKGLTPNPDMYCNREIKFSRFIDAAMQLGVDAVATGHYAKLEGELEDEARPLCIPADRRKDQTYFLGLVPHEAFAKVLFPLGTLTKPQVRALASEFGLPNARRPDSQGICFVGKRSFPEFIGNYVELQPGPVVRVEGDTIGEHRGLPCYTIGQRARLGGLREPLYVYEKDTATNTLRVAPKGHAVHFSDGLTVQWKTFNDLSGGLFGAHASVHATTEWPKHKSGGSLPLRCRIRHGGALNPCRLSFGPDGIHVHFHKPVEWIAPGQAAVLYEGDRCIAGGVIEARIPPQQ